MCSAIRPLVGRISHISGNGDVVHISMNNPLLPEFAYIEKLFTWHTRIEEETSVKWSKSLDVANALLAGVCPGAYKKPIPDLKLGQLVHFLALPFNPGSDHRGRANGTAFTAHSLISGVCDACPEQSRPSTALLCSEFELWLVNLTIVVLCNKLRQNKQCTWIEYP